jgi:hypothetical protein
MAQWLRKLLVDLQLDLQGHLAREGAPLPVVVDTDNQGAIALLYNPSPHGAAAR